MKYEKKNSIYIAIVIDVFLLIDKNTNIKNKNTNIKTT